MGRAMRRVGSIAIFVALLGVYAATGFMDDSSHRASPAADPPSWTGAQAGFDENGVPTVRMTTGKRSPAVIRCRRIANDQVPVGSVLDAMVAARADRPGAIERYNRLAHEYNDALAACLANTA
jgi:hypothetical protein